MSLNIPTHFVKQYTANVKLKLQETAKLRPTVMESSAQGDGAVAVDQFGSIEATRVTARFQPMPRMDAPTDRVWAYPIAFHVAQMIDTFDRAKLMTQPDSYLVETAAAAMGRSIDTIIIERFFAAMATGVAGATSTTFDSTNHRVDAAIGASADTGMNLDKVLRAKRLLRAAHVDLEREEAWIGLGEAQEEDLMNKVRVTSGDFTRAHGIVVNDEGKLVRISGLRVVVSTLFENDGSYRLCPVWVKSGMHLKVWQDVSARMDPRADMSSVPEQLYTSGQVGATRTEQGRVIQIECTES